MHVTQLDACKGSVNTTVMLAKTDRKHILLHLQRKQLQNTNRTWRPVLESNSLHSLKYSYSSMQHLEVLMSISIFCHYFLWHFSHMSYGCESLAVLPNRHLPSKPLRWFHLNHRFKGSGRENYEIFYKWHRSVENPQNNFRVLKQNFVIFFFPAPSIISGPLRFMLLAIAGGLTPYWTVCKAPLWAALAVTCCWHTDELQRCAIFQSTS